MKVRVTMVAIGEWDNLDQAQQWVKGLQFGYSSGTPPRGGLEFKALGAVEIEQRAAPSESATIAP